MNVGMAASVWVCESLNIPYQWEREKVVSPSELHKLTIKVSVDRRDTCQVQWKVLVEHTGKRPSLWWLMLYYTGLARYSCGCSYSKTPHYWLVEIRREPDGEQTTMYSYCPSLMHECALRSCLCVCKRQRKAKKEENIV